MPESPGNDQLNARGAKNPGQPEPPPSASGEAGSTLPPRAHSAKDPGQPEPPPTANPDDTNHAITPIDTGPPEPPPTIVVTAAAAAFLAGAHAMQAYLTDCFNMFAVGLTAIEIAAAVLLIQWLIDTVYARGHVDQGQPEPPPLSTVPPKIAAALLALASVIGIVLGLMGQCLSGLHIVLGIADGVLAIWLMTLVSQVQSAGTDAK